MSERIRVLVVDDSALMRKLIPTILERDPSIEVVGTAMDGAFALKKIEELHPDVITLDLEMPRMDGLETLRLIMRRAPMPVIVFSTHSKEGAYSTFKALALGAIDFVAKPRDAAAGHLDAIAVELIEKIKVAKRASGRKIRANVEVETKPPQKKPSRAALPPSRVVAIGISTGGPNALQYVLSQIPADFAATILIVQHMPEGFTEMFARRLDECCALDVHEARSGDLLIAGRVLICPGNRHIIVRRMPRGDMAVLSDGPPVNGHRPSADVLFQSVAQEFAITSVGLLMTGMGDDGAEGLGAIKAAGGMTVAQSEDTCVVSGMPRAAILKGYATKIVPLESLSAFLIGHCGSNRVPDRDRAERASARKKRKRKTRLKRTEKPRGHTFLPTVASSLRGDKEKAMQQFAALLRKDSRPVRYLVVDDSVFARKNLIKMIEMFGGEVAGEAGDGLTAIAEYNRTKPDIVLMDITMPQMEGIEAVERIVRQHAEARIVMVSSVGYQENILAALQKGAKHFVQKPVKPEVLYEILRYVLSDDPTAAGAPVALAGEHRS